ncbi:VanZ family protein [Puteibacter caeruleilacunae]|nr:VanZ family protein [Puteibacter caeruleilacunae]
MFKTIFNYRKPILWIFVIFALCLTPGDRIPNTNLQLIPHFDKIVHSGLYFVLMLFLLASVHTRTKFNILTAMLCGLILGLFVELAQYYWIPNRSGNWQDMLANFSGILLAIFLFKPLLKHRLFRIVCTP